MGAIAAAFGIAFISLLGEVVYAGIVSAMVIGDRRGVSHPLASALRSLPYARLVGADVLYALVIVGGLLLLVVPGFIFMVWFALVAPIIEAEDRRIVDSMRRSRALVRPHFWRVAAVVVPLVFLSEVLSDLVFSGAIHALGETLGGEWVGSLLVELLTAPLLALFVVVLFLELRSES